MNCLLIVLVFFALPVIGASRSALRTVMSVVNAVALIVAVNSSIAKVWLRLATALLIGSLIAEPSATGVRL